MITFKECQSPGYRARTMINASADITIAIAKDFNTAGERLTFNCVKQQGKAYLGIHYEELNDSVLTSVNVFHSTIGLKIETLNIAGNGIYTINEHQSSIDIKVLAFLDNLLALRLQANITIPKLIRSGGQTGIDEAGLKAAVKLGIPALCLAPKGWIFRDINGKDISNEEQFKARFK